MEKDVTTGKFSKFSYSLKYPIVWWCMITSAASIVTFVFILKELFKTSEIEDLPFVIKVTTKTGIILNILMILSTRYLFVFQFRNLTKAMEYMKTVETNLEGDDHPACKSTIRFRIIFGVIFGFLGVSIEKLLLP